MKIERIEELLAMDIKQADFMTNLLRTKIRNVSVGTTGTSPLRAAIDIISKLPSMPKPSEVFI